MYQSTMIFQFRSVFATHNNMLITSQGWVGFRILLFHVTPFSVNVLKKTRDSNYRNVCSFYPVCFFLPTLKN